MRKSLSSGYFVCITKKYTRRQVLTTLWVLKFREGLHMNTVYGKYLRANKDFKMLFALRRREKYGTNLPITVIIKALILLGYYYICVITEISTKKQYSFIKLEISSITLFDPYLFVILPEEVHCYIIGLSQKVSRRRAQIFFHPKYFFPFAYLP